VSHFWAHVAAIYFPSKNRFSNSPIAARFQGQIQLELSSKCGKSVKFESKEFLENSHQQEPLALEKSIWGRKNYFHYFQLPLCVGRQRKKNHKQSTGARLL
jgi:hypothetical protein